MKVFISWSGKISGQIGEIFRFWLPSVLQSVKPYYTPDDIEKGARWNTEIAQELKDSKIGILFVTRENLNSAWLLFEAGALSTQLTKSHVCPLLIGIDNNDLKGPLNQFQTTSFNKKEIFKLLSTINSQLAEGKLEEDVLSKVFEKWWPDLERDVNKVSKENKDVDAKPIRSERDLIEEILQLARLINKKENPQQKQAVSIGAVKHLLNNFENIYTLVRAHSQDVEVMGKLKELSKSVIHIPIQLFGREQIEPDISRVWSLKYVCDDDIPF
ncbi:MAG TPA: TIR domain-containing protein [Phycisphaerales bacterium]|nr:TIR domain-containing protein [Phycisphaerales bacterium]